MHEASSSGDEEEGEMMMKMTFGVQQLPDHPHHGQFGRDLTKIGAKQLSPLDTPA
jgi:hypothetical protein